MATLVLILCGGAAGALGGAAVTVVIDLFLKIPNVERGGESLYDLIGLLQTLMIIGVVSAYKHSYRRWLAPSGPVRIGFLRALSIGVLVSAISLPVIASTELALSQSQYALSPWLIPYSFVLHPILFCVLTISSILSLWTTMPRWLQSTVSFLQMVDVIEKV